MNTLSEIAETVKPVLSGAARFLEECGRREPCDLADPALVLEARVLPSPAEDEPEAVESRAELRLAPTIGGDDLLDILSWVRERAKVATVSGRGVEVSLGLTAPWIEEVLRALELVAWTIRSLIGPGVHVRVTGVLDERGRTRWSLSLHLCETVDAGPGGLAEHGVHAALALIRALHITPEALSRLRVEASSEQLTTPAGEEYVCTGIRIKI